MTHLEAEPDPYSTQKQHPFRFKLESCRSVALEYDPSGHEAQTDDDVAPAVGSIQ